MWFMEPTEEERQEAMRQELAKRSGMMPPQAMANPTGGNPLQAEAPLQPGDKRYLDSLYQDQAFMDSLAPQDAEARRLEKQMMMAEELSNSGMAKRYKTPGGVLLGGIADIGKAFQGAKLRGETASKMDALGAKMDKGARNRLLLDRGTQAEEHRIRAEQQGLRLQAEEAKAKAQAEAEAQGRAQEREQKLADIAAERAWREKQEAMNRASQERAAALSAGRKDDAREATDMKKREGEAREIEERYRNMERALTRMDAMVKDHGTFEAVGPHNAELEALITDYATDAAKLRDPTSVARETEVAGEKKALFEPGSITTRNETAAALLKKARERLNERRDEAYRVRRLEVPQRQVTAPAAPAAQTQPPAMMIGKQRYVLQPDGQYLPE